MEKQEGPFVGYARFLNGYGDEGERKKLINSTGPQRVDFDNRLQRFEEAARAVFSSHGRRNEVPAILWIISRLTRLPDTETGIALLEACGKFLLECKDAGLPFSWEDAFDGSEWERMAGSHEPEFTKGAAKGLCGDPYHHFAIVAQTCLVKMHYRSFDYAAADEAAKKAIRLAEQHGYYPWTLKLVGNRSNVLMYAGEYEKAAESLSRTLKLVKIAHEECDSPVIPYQRYYSVHNNLSFLYLLWARELSGRYERSDVPKDVAQVIEEKIYNARMHADQAISHALQMNDVESIIRAQNNLLEAKLRFSLMAKGPGKVPDRISLEEVAFSFDRFVAKYKASNPAEFAENAGDVYGNAAEAYSAAGMQGKAFEAVIEGMKVSTVGYDSLNERLTAMGMRRLLILYGEPLREFVIGTAKEDFGTGKEAGRAFWKRINENPVVASLAQFMQAKDANHGGGHPRRMMRIAAALYPKWKKKGGADFSLAEALWSIFFHDIGKMEVPQMTLGKVRKLSEREFAVVRSHIDATEEICGELGLMVHDGRPWIGTHASQHHENLLGTGYPHGIRDMTPVAQFIAVVDTMESATSRRSYVTSAHGGLAESPFQKLDRLASEFEIHRVQGKFDPSLLECAIGALFEMKKKEG